MMMVTFTYSLLSLFYIHNLFRTYCSISATSLRFEILYHLNSIPLVYQLIGFISELLRAIVFQNVPRNDEVFNLYSWLRFRSCLY